MKTNKLHNIKESGFEIPKGYFDSLEDTIISNIKLKELSSESGFKTPDNYFDSLEETILSKISEKENTKVISLFTRQNIVYLSGIAAAILLLFNLNIFNNDSLDWNLDTETVENYIIDENISSYEIASLLNEDELIENNFSQHSLSDETIETFILNDVDIDDLILE